MQQDQPMPSRAVLAAAASGSATGARSGFTTGTKAESSSGCTSGGGASCLSRKCFLRGRHACPRR
eukprot:3839959-Amphidinium_carterae.1